MRDASGPSVVSVQVVVYGGVMWYATTRHHPALACDRVMVVLQPLYISSAP